MSNKRVEKMKKLLQSVFEKKYFCPLCDQMTFFEDMVNDVEVRKHAKCSKCGSLERHRFLYLLYKLLFLDTAKKIKVLHVAPEMIFYELINKNQNIDYRSMDLYPELYSYAQNIIKGDITNMPFEDNTFDFVIHNQVLEHIKQEEQCIKECLRVLKPGGMCIINIPYSEKKENNYQDDTIETPEGRKKAYYQSDHVRLYGKECLDRFVRKFDLYRIDADFLARGIMKQANVKRDSVFLQDAYYILKK